MILKHYLVLLKVKIFFYLKKKKIIFGYSDLQATANGIRQDFKSALDKYNKYQQEKHSSTKSNVLPPAPPPIPNPSKPREKIENGNLEKQMRYPAEDIRFKNKPQPQTTVPIPVIPQVPLVSNIYQDEDDEEEQSEKSNNTPIAQCKSNNRFLFNITFIF